MTAHRSPLMRHTLGGLWTVINYAAMSDGSTTIHDTLRSSRELFLQTVRQR